MTDRERIALLEKQMQGMREQMQEHQARTQRQVSQIRHRLYATWATVCVGIVFAFVLGLSPEVRAQAGRPFQELQSQINTLAARVSILETQLSTHDTRLTTVEGRVSTLGTQVSTLNDKTQYVSVSGTDMIIEGANLHIRSGSGATNGNPVDPYSLATTSVNGRGNLIIGYNEGGSSYDYVRSGSHNLVIGNAHDYTSFGGLVVGQASRILAPFASVSGGNGNIASGFSASVSGGISNTANGYIASISGGIGNMASGDLSSVSGGSGNTASGHRSSVSGGIDNTATGNGSSVSGGVSNAARGNGSSVSGGRFRTSPGNNNWVAGDLFQEE